MATLTILASFLLMLALVLLWLVWLEHRRARKALELASIEREYGLRPRASRRWTIEELIKGAKGQRGEPVFVVPVAEFRRVNIDGAGSMQRVLIFQAVRREG
ncbi:hypothetical protein [Allohahella sp. A8]|uniref:hypothetical protein n=1 Tax=Allohahella sp. A8 TaxID=3141461 RepID=UPI003A8086E1